MFSDVATLYHTIVSIAYLVNFQSSVETFHGCGLFVCGDCIKRHLYIYAYAKFCVYSQQSIMHAPVVLTKQVYFNMA